MQRQQGELYGPLLSYLNAGKVAMESAKRALAQKQIVPMEEMFEDPDGERVRFRSDWRWFAYPVYDRADRKWSGNYVPQKAVIVREWRLWVRAVMQPNNEAMMALILRSGHLALAEDAKRGRELFDCLISHILSYRAVIGAWDGEDATQEASMAPAGTAPIRLHAYENTAVVPFPQGLVGYVQQCCERLDDEQNALLRQLARFERSDPREGSGPYADSDLRAGAPKAPETFVDTFLRRSRMRAVGHDRSIL